MSLNFYANNGSPDLVRIRHMDHESCLLICRHADHRILTKDLEAWRDQATHGDSFMVNPNYIILALDLTTFGIPQSF